MSQSIDLYPFQLETVRRVRETLGGSAIIADEVGLGKTIEAGALINERVQGSPDANILVCVPKALLYQWRAELLYKFDLFFELEGGLPETSLFKSARGLRLLVSHGKLSVLPHDHPVRNVSWQTVVVDEAHRFSNPRSKRYQALKSLRKSSTILLTATPIQNSLLDLYWLSELVRPGALSHSSGDFVDTFAVDRHALQVRLSRRGELKSLLDRLMTRTTRQEAGVDFPPREVRSISCTPKDWEKRVSVLVETVLEETVDFTRRSLHASGFSRSQILQGLSSHPRAALGSIESALGIGDHNLLTEIKKLVAMGLPTGKEQELLGSIRTLGIEEPWLVFVERLTTGEELLRLLHDEGMTCAFYRGSLDSAERDALVTSFRSGQVQVLISTSAGSEGLNLQHCRNLVNFDLHWNPLRMEQRIGRIHRLGQQRTVRIVNLVTTGSIDQLILERLYLKLNLFEAAVGEISTVLSTFEDGYDMEDEIRSELESSTDPEAFSRSIDAICEKMANHMSEERRRELAQPY